MVRTCLNCGEELKGSGHFVPPGTGDVGFYFCKPKGVCANCGGRGRVENSSSAIHYGAPEEIDCPTCKRVDPEETKEKE